MPQEVHCYNKGCGQKFLSNKNTAESCKFHPGGPIFHDALKGWSCCKKRSTDFTEFLNIPGCTIGYHSNEKPEQPEKQKNAETPDIKEVVQECPKPPPPPMARPSEAVSRVKLPVSTVASLEKALEKKMKEMQLEGEAKKDGSGIAIGTVCHNKSCNKGYEGEQSNLDECVYHPGAAIFHEGMKYWSCCEKKTSDFNAFLNQEGCTRGKHLWEKEESKVIDCRVDYYQTAGNIVISIFSKTPVPSESFVEANQVSLDIHIVFEGGKSVFKKKISLNGVVSLAGSSVKMMGTKVEIVLKKAEPGSWSNLYHEPTKVVNHDAGGEDNLDDIEANEPPTNPPGTAQ